jgi:hypothetical protein
MSEKLTRGPSTLQKNSQYLATVSEGSAIPSTVPASFNSCEQVLRPQTLGGRADDSASPSGA